jgi:hypothetical protein
VTKSLRLPALLVSLALELAARADTTLAPASPFAPPDGVAAVTGENQPLELRGILMDSAGYRFSVYDPVKKTGQWVRLNETGYNFTVRVHDVARDTITLDYQGRTLTLPLRNAKVVGMAVPTVPTEPVATSASGPGLGPRPTAGASGMGPQIKPPTPEETARFNRAVEEINRRRALREKGGTTGPNSMPMPMPGSPSSTPMPTPPVPK